MASIGQQIINARKAKGMTQEDLARALNVSRSAVSHWERDRRMPDAESMLRMSKMLSCTFRSGDSAEGPEAVAPPSEVEAPMEPQATTMPHLDTREGIYQSDALPGEAAAAPKRRFRWALACVAFALVCAALFFALRPAGEQTYRDEENNVYTRQQFEEVAPNVAGQAYLRLDTTLTTQQADDYSVWMYTIRGYEQNGVACTVERYETYTFVDDKVHVMRYNDEMMAAADMECSVPAYGDWEVTGGLPIQDKVKGMGFIIYATDETGAHHSFSGFIPLAA